MARAQGESMVIRNAIKLINNAKKEVIIVCNRFPDDLIGGVRMGKGYRSKIGMATMDLKKMGREFCKQNCGIGKDTPSRDMAESCLRLRQVGHCPMQVMFKNHVPSWVKVP